MEFLSAFGNWCGGPALWQGSGHGWNSWMPFHFRAIFQLIIIGLIIYLTTRLLRKPATTNGAEPPEAILKRRNATGDTDNDTYRILKEELQNRR